MSVDSGYFNSFTNTNLTVIYFNLSDLFYLKRTNSVLRLHFCCKRAEPFIKALSFGPCSYRITIFVPSLNFPIIVFNDAQALQIGAVEQHKTVKLNILQDKSE